MRDGNAFGGATARWSGSQRDDSSVWQKATWVNLRFDARWLLLRGIRLICSHPDDGYRKRQDRQSDYGERSASHRALGG
jgi:hypothetical protein